MKLCIISDTHGKHKQLALPDADVIIHCGDFTTVGREHEIRKFFKWFGSLSQYKYKIIVAGNHDVLFEYNGMLARSLVPKNVHYLQDSGVDIEGFKFYGSPVQLAFCNWAFNREEYMMKRHWEAIPDDTDVLITHSPPHGVGDFLTRTAEHLGSESLYDEVVNRVKPIVHCYGHIHDAYGIREVHGVKFINASILNEDYIPANDIVVIEI